MRFGGVTALAGVSFATPRSGVLGIIGPNGSGKTTLVNCVTGFLRPTGGRVLFRGRDVTGRAPHRIADLGVTRTFQVMRPHSSLPAYKNLVIPLTSPRTRRLGGWRGGGRHGDRDAVALDILEDLGFERDSRVPYQAAGTTSSRMISPISRFCENSGTAIIQASALIGLAMKIRLGIIGIRMTRPM